VVKGRNDFRLKEDPYATGGMLLLLITGVGAFGTIIGEDRRTDAKGI